MRRFLVTPVLAAFLAVSGPAWAQETAEEDSAQSQLSMGEDANALPFDIEPIGDWELRCLPSEGSADSCQLYQLLTDGDGNAVAEMSLFRLGGGGQAVAGAVITVPLETLLTAQLLISVDGAKARRYPYSFCNPVGCVARIGLTEEDVASYRAGAKAQLTIVPALAPDQKVTLDASLSGFTAGYEKVSKLEN